MIGCLGKKLLLFIFLDRYLASYQKTKLFFTQPDEKYQICHRFLFLTLLNAQKN